MNPKTRLITIRRTITQLVEEKGKQVEKKVQKNFPCRVNAGVPYGHHICEHGWNPPKFDW